MSQKQSKDFKSLQDKWYKKLNKTGFKDIEQTDGNLKVWSSHFFKVRYNTILFQAKQEYYSRAGKFLNEYKFSNKFEKIVWEMHSNGASIKEIAAFLKKKGIKPHGINLVNRKLQQLTKEMMKLCL